MRCSATMTIYRPVRVPVFVDAAGVPEYETEEMEIEVMVSGVRQPAQRSVGIMSDYFEDVVATAENGVEYELSAREMDRAQEALAEDYTDARTAAAEDRWRAAREAKL